MPEKIPHLSKKDRERILDRDNHTSGMRHYDEKKGGWYFDQNCPFDGKPCDHLQVHHISPVRFLINLFILNENVNLDENVITLFQCQHIGICDSNRISDEYARKR